MRSIGQTLVEFESIGSTNQEAADRIAQSRVQHGTVLLAHQQTAGRGQRGRSWSSVPGLDLTFSIVLLPQSLRADKQFGLAKAAALSVLEVVISRVKHRTRIKWPNDILVESRKVSGILIENQIVGGLIRSSVVGIGLNVNSTELDMSYSPTSLKSETGIEYDRMELLNELCMNFDRHYNRIIDSDVGLDMDYLSHLWSKGEWTTFELDGLPIKGRPLQVDAEGRLVIEQESGEVATYGYERLRFAAR